MSDSSISRDVAQAAEELRQAASVLTSGTAVVGRAGVPGIDIVPTALTQTTGTRSSEGEGSTAGTVIGALSQFTPLMAPARSPLSGWLRWVSPIGALLSMFGGGDEEETTPEAATAKFNPKAGARYEKGIRAQDRWRLQDVDYGQDGRARAVGPTGAVPNVVVQVQAIDSRSFLDHSEAIAEAVKKSLLESHGLGDALKEL